MPHWMALVAIVVVAWMALAVLGGWLIGRGLGAFERRAEAGGEAGADREEARGLGRAA